MTTSVARTSFATFSMLMLGDMAVFVIFAVLGVQTHNEGNAVLTVVRAGAPFAISWFVVGSLLGVFRRSVWANTFRTLWLIPLVWAACDAAALIGRSIWLDNAIVPSFAVVTLVFVAGLMTLWRTAFALTVGRRTG